VKEGIRTYGSLPFTTNSTCLVAAPSDSSWETIFWNCSEERERDSEGSEGEGRDTVEREERVVEVIRRVVEASSGVRERGEARKFEKSVSQSFDSLDLVRPES